MTRDEIRLLATMSISGPAMLHIKICQEILNKNKSMQTIAEDFKISLSHAYWVMHNKCFCKEIPKK